MQLAQKNEQSKRTVAWHQAPHFDPLFCFFPLLRSLLPVYESWDRAIMNVESLAQIGWAGLCWNTLLKGLAYNGIITFCFLLELIFVIVFRFTDGVVPRKACAFFDKFSSTLSSVWFSYHKSRRSDRFTTEFKGKTFFVSDIVNVFSVNKWTGICIGCHLPSTILRRYSVLCVQGVCGT